MKKFLALAAAGALMTAPTAATAANAASTLSVAQAETTASDEGGSGGLFGSPEATAGVVIFGFIVIIGILAAAGTFDNDDAVSA